MCLFFDAANSDYLPSTKTILFQPAVSSFAQNCTSFEIVNDDIVEGEESFFIELTTTGDDQIILDNSRTQVVVRDTDVVYVDYVERTQTVGESDGSASVCVELSAEVESEVTVQLATDDDTARQPRDYARTYEVLRFQPRAERRQCVSIAVRDDDILEEDEQFLVYIFDSERSRVRDQEGEVKGFVEVEPSGSGGGVEVLSGGVRSVVVIRDNDRVTIGMVVPEYTVVESASEVTVCLKMEGEMERKVDVYIRTVNGEAIGEENPLINHLVIMTL